MNNTGWKIISRWMYEWCKQFKRIFTPKFVITIKVGKPSIIKAVDFLFRYFMKNHTTTWRGKFTSKSVELHSKTWSFIFCNSPLIGRNDRNGGNMKKYKKRACTMWYSYTKLILTQCHNSLKFYREQRQKLW